MIPEEGMPIYRRSHENGNLFVIFEVNFPPPHWIADDKLVLLEQMLPKRKELPNLQGRVVDECFLENVDPSRYVGRNANSHDEEHEQQGGPSVQCAQQ